MEVFKLVQPQHGSVKHHLLLGDVEVITGNNLYQFVTRDGEELLLLR